MTATPDPALLLAKAHYPVTTLGPGTRAGIWTQGCTLHCPGCLSRDTWEPDPETAVPVAAVLGWLNSLPGPVDGVTISGGEPFQQPAALAALLRGLHDWRAARRAGAERSPAGTGRAPTETGAGAGAETGAVGAEPPPGPDILVYSGYVYTRLARSAKWREILDMCDAVITGPYIDRLNPANPGLPWRGSANQRIVPLSPLGRDRYAPYAAAGDERPAEAAHQAAGPRVQVSVDEGPEGRRVYYIGIPRRGDMDHLSTTLERAGIRAGDVSWRP